VSTAQQILVDQVVTAPAFYPMLLTVPFPVSSAYLITSERCRALVDGLLLGLTVYALEVPPNRCPRRLPTGLGFAPFPVSRGFHPRLAPWRSNRLLDLECRVGHWSSPSWSSLRCLRSGCLRTH